MTLSLPSSGLQPRVCCLISLLGLFMAGDRVIQFLSEIGMALLSSSITGRDSLVHEGMTVGLNPIGFKKKNMDP